MHQKWTPSHVFFKRNVKILKISYLQNIDSHSQRLFLYFGCALLCNDINWINSSIHVIAFCIIFYYYFQRNSSRYSERMVNMTMSGYWHISCKIPLNEVLLFYKSSLKILLSLIFLKKDCQDFYLSVIAFHKFQNTF